MGDRPRQMRRSASMRDFVFLALALALPITAVTPEPLEADRDHLYETLGIRPDADQQEVKKAYKALALQWHPDKHQGKKTEFEAHDKFLHIGKAYSVLSDPEKREIYDKQGMAGMEKTRNPPSHDIMHLNALMQQLFGHRQMSQPGDVFMQHRVSLEEMYTGVRAQINRKQMTICEHCAGAGGEGYHTCDHCHGQGRLVKQTQPVPGIVFQTVTGCPHCHGKGHTVESHCEHCHGTGRVEKERTDFIELEPGTPDQIVLQVDEAGDFVFSEAKGGKHGNLRVQVVTAAHDRFQRDGRNLYTVQDITLVQSLLGVKTTLLHLDGSQVPVETEKGKVAKHGSVMKLIGYGMPSYHMPEQGRGDLFVQFNVVFPDTADDTLEALQGGTRREGADVAECQRELSLLKDQVATAAKPCSTAGKIPIGSWSGEKVLKSKPEFIKSARAAGEL